MFEYDEELYEAVKTLDEYDFSDYLRKYATEHNGLELDLAKESILSMIDDESEKLKIENAFASFGEYEFMEYFRRRYRVRWREIIINYMIVDDKFLSSCKR